MSAVVELQSVCKHYFLPGGQAVPALEDINLSVGAGEFVGIMGASGSGKSTMLNILGLLDLPTSGKYLLENTEVSTLTDDQLSDLRNRRIGFIFQSFNLFGHLTVRQNIEVPLVYGGAPVQERRDASERLAKRLGLGHRLGHRPPELSGGERQRVAIARALVTRPAFLLADEPTGNLDEKTGEEVMGIFHELHAGGTTIIMVTHNPEYAPVFDRVLRLRDGREDTESC